MKTVTATVKVTFQVEDDDDETILEGLHNALEEKIEEGELLSEVKLKIVNDEEDEEELELEDEDEE